MKGSAQKGRFGLLGGYTVVYLVFIYVPVLLLPIFSFNDAIYVAFPLKGFTLRWWEEMLAQKTMLEALGNSFKVALMVSIVSTTFGMLAAKAFTSYRMWGARALTGFLTVPLVIPLLILGIALLVVFNAIGIELSLLTIALSHVAICVPFAMFVLMSRLEGFDKNLEEAALDLGETPWMTFWRVTFPLALPGVAASLLLTFTISFDEFLLAFFLVGDEVTLPIYIWSQLRFPAKLPAVLALGSAILVASFLVVTIAERLRRQGSLFARNKPTQAA